MVVRGGCDNGVSTWQVESRFPRMVLFLSHRKLVDLHELFFGCIANDTKACPNPMFLDLLVRVLEEEDSYVEKFSLLVSTLYFVSVLLH